MGDRPVVAMVVNNAVAHDARVVKSALTLGRAGADVRVLGVGTSGEREVATSAGATFERLPVLPPRAVAPDYAWWAAARRVGRLYPAHQWERSLPVTGYYRRAFLPRLDEIGADVVHVHDVHLLATAVEHAERARGAGRTCHVVYDAHEYVQGLAVSGARTQRAVDGWAALERQRIRAVDRVITVAEGLADLLETSYDLPRRPAVVHNAPIAWVGTGTSSRSLRAEAGVGPQVPLAVYSGALSAARGVDTAVEALGLLPELHLAVVAVPYPHPLAARLHEVAERVGAGDRLHMVPPVPSHEVSAYLAEADLAVSPILGDSVSYDLALPNKLFEFLHAGLPMAVSDCRAMAAFVTEHRLGGVFRAGDATDLSRAVREVLADEEPRPDTTALRELYSWQGQEPALVGTYRELVEGLEEPQSAITAEDLRLQWHRAPDRRPARPPR